MRHGKKVNKLGRTSAHRKALMMNLANALIEHKRIQTTQAKAKALREYVEPLITKCKEDTVHNRRLVFSKLQSKEAIMELFGPISDKVADRPGGYTRIIKLQARRSDAADLAMIELVDFNELYDTDKKTTKTRRTRRAGRKTVEATTTTEEVIQEETTTEVEETENNTSKSEDQKETDQE